MKIAFFNKTKQVMGGGLLQFFSLASYLAERTDHEIYYINYYNPEIDKMIKSTNIFFVDVENMDSVDWNGTHFITPINYCFVLAEMIQDYTECKLLFYDWHPFAGNFLANQIENGDADFKSFFQKLADSNAVAFMDKSTQLSLQEFSDVLFPPKYIPVVKEIDESRYTQNAHVQKNPLRIAWLGRLDMDKIYAVINIADQIMNANLEETIDFHIIGDGNKKNLLQTEQYAGKIRFIFTSYLFGDGMYDYLKKNVDILFSMGTAALNGAEVGLPVAIVPMSTKRFYNNQYVYLFDTKEYTLGWRPDQLKELGYPSHRLDTIIYDALNHKEEYGKRCFEHFKKHHVMETAGQSCLQYIIKSKLTLGDFLSTPVAQEQMSAFLSWQKRQEGDYLDFINIVQDKKHAASQGRYTKLRNWMIQSMIDLPLGALQKQYAKHYNYKKYMATQKHYDTVITKLRQKISGGEKLNVAFLVVYDSVFPTLRLFEEMCNDALFSPVIIVVPDVERGIRHQIETFEATCSNLMNRFPNHVLRGYDVECDEYMELYDDYDIVVFCNPYSKMAHKYHHVTYFLDKDVLTVYANYGFFTVKFGREIVKQPFYNYVWKVFLDSETNYVDLKKTEPIKGKNGVVVGYMKMDNLADVPIEKKNRKRILICPHHTVMGWKALDISNFLRYSDFILQLPELYPEIDFIFRPHPMLFSNLLNKMIWTEQKIEQYIEAVNSHPNMYYDQDGDYLTTFANSDAMIHDCASFTAEYLFTEKPCCYMLKDESQIDDVFLPMGKKCMEHYYKAFNEQDIKDFIDSVIVQEKDPKKEQREQFARKELKFNYPNSTVTALKYIKQQLGVID